VLDVRGLEIRRTDDRREVVYTHHEFVVLLLNPRLLNFDIIGYERLRHSTH
jgi:hypothetical protein